MALEAGRESPTSSGRASPIPRRWRNQQGADDAPNKDKTYRRYASGVERSLSLFDTALQEWADYISFLSRLLKSLQAHPPTITIVPSKSIVSKRLAQCLNPSLPSGVHQKALEVYGYIFSMIGKDALSVDLPLYLPGLSSTLSFASLSVRAPFLDLVERYLLHLDPRSLRPALKAIVLSLLPGLEEESSEEFERTLKLLDGFKHSLRASGVQDLGEGHSTGDGYFWQCFFLAAITSGGRRLGALAYLVRSLPKLGQHFAFDGATLASTSGRNGENQVIATRLAEIVTSPEPGLLLRCFAAGLGDEQLLIQRGFLDLLVTLLPLHSDVLQKRVKSEDLELLLSAAVGVVSRREMSLNRRLWTWLLGPEPSVNDQEAGPESPVTASDDHPLTSTSTRTHYFEKYGLRPLTNALLNMIKREHVHPVERARPFRICLSLMDRWEIGGLVVPDIFLPVINSVRSYEEQAGHSKADFSEVLRSASVFFDGVESGLIWGEIISLIVQAVGRNKISTADRIEKLSLVNFIITHFNVREEEMLLIHAPLATLTILTLLRETRDNVSLEEEKSSEVAKLASAIATDLIELIPERAFQTRPSTSQSTATAHNGNNTRLSSNSDILEKIKTFYIQNQGNLDAFSPPYAFSELSELLLFQASNITCHSLNVPVSSADAGINSKLLEMMLAKIPKVESLDVPKLLSSMQSRISVASPMPFLAFTSIMSLTTNLYSTSYISAAQISSLVDPLVRQAWSYLSASHPKYHVEAVRGLWQLQIALSPSNREIEAAICSRMVEKDLDGTFALRDADAGRSFSILWTHTLQDIVAHADRRASRASVTDMKTGSKLSALGSFEVMLARPVFLLLDALLDERTQLFMTVRTWLQNLVGIDKLFHLFAVKFSEFPFLGSTVKEGVDFLGSEAPSYTNDDDLDQCLYYLKTLSNILRWSSDSMWAVLARNTITIEQGPQSLHAITGKEGEITLLEVFLHVCLRIICGSQSTEESDTALRCSQFQRVALTTLHQILLSSYAMPLAKLHLEHILIDRLVKSLDGSDPFIQVLLLDVVFDTLKIRDAAKPAPPPLSPTVEKRSMLSDTMQNSRPSLITDTDSSSAPIPPPSSLVKCLQAGFSARSSRPVLDSWVSFLVECLPLYADTIFQILIPLVETFCTQIGNTFKDLEKTFAGSGIDIPGPTAPESTLISLLNGLEHVLASGHAHLLQDEAKAPIIKSPDAPQGFFGNMVSNVFTSDTPQSRSATANNRLTVLLTFQDAVRICFLIWSWGGNSNIFQDAESAASFNYTSLRMRNRARRLLEHLFAAEALECLESAVEIWKKSAKAPNESKSPVVFNLLHVLDGSRPKHTIPAIFNAIYSRTNPTALDPSRKSTLTSSLNDTDLVVFLVDYARSLEDDAMDEIWTDCMTFLKDLLANPFPHRQTLPSLLEFAGILGEKVDNTNFGEQRRMRRELGDLFLRLLTAIFTTKPIGFSENSDNDNLARPDDVVGILVSITPNLPKILVEPDRVLTAANTISTSVIVPTFKSKTFPENVSKSTLVLLYQLARLPNTQKSWKKDLSDAFNDPRFFANSVALVESDWLPLIRQWALSDKERMPELLSRLVAPTTAGIVFGVGATSARLEADRKAQLNLRRITTLILSTVDDNFVTDLPAMQEKIVELLPATTTSSPSSTTRADIYILLRALVLKTSAIHVATLWPIINAELNAVISSVVAPDHSAAAETYNNYAVLQACKLLDTLLCIAPDDFQLHEWLFISDTIDAVYRPPQFQPVALVDELSEELGSASLSSAVDADFHAVHAANSSTRRPLIGPGGISDEGSWERKDELVAKVLRPFFSQLSIFSFETTYSMNPPDYEACRASLLKDLFDERSIVKAL